MVLDQSSAPTAVASDAALLHAWGEGDAHAFDDLVARYAPLVFGRCRRALGDADADDATQAVFLVLARRREQAAASPVLAAWLMRVAQNVVRNALRDRHRRRQAERALPPPQTHVQEPTMPGFQDHLDACLAELPVAERDTVTLHHLAGLSLAEVATRTDAGASTVKDRLVRGLERLRKAFLARGLTLSLPLLLSLLATEASAGVPAAVTSHVHAIAATGSTAVSDRAQRWSQEPLSTMTRIAIAASAFLLVGGSLTAIAFGAEAGDPVAARAAAPRQVQPAGGQAPTPYLDPEHARSYAVLRWNDGARTVARLRSMPEIALLPPEALAVLDQVGSLRQAVVVASMSALMPREERVRQFRLQRDMAELPPAGRVELMREEYQRVLKTTEVAQPGEKEPAALGVTVTTGGADQMVQADTVSLVPWPCLHGWLEFSAADAPALQAIRARLGDAAPLLGGTPRATPQGWSIDSGNGSCRVALSGGRIALAGADDPGLAPITALAARPAAAAADLECSFILDPGLPGVALRRTGDLHFTVAKDGLEVSSLFAWPTPAQAAEAATAPRLDLGRLSTVPADAFLVAALPMSPAATRDSEFWMAMFVGIDLTLAGVRRVNVEDAAVMAKVCGGVRELIGRCEGTVVLWMQPGTPMPTLTIEVDTSREAADALIASTGLPRGADGSVNQLLGMVSLGLAWQQGRLVCTTVPGGVEAVSRAGDLLKQPDVVRAVAAMPTRQPQLCVLLRPAAFADTIGPYVSMLSPEWMQRMQTYEQRLAADQAYGFLTVHQDAGGTHVNATGALSVLAAGILAAQAAGPMAMPRIAN